MKPTRATALAVVEGAPGQAGRDAIVGHVERALVEAYEQGKRDAHPEARARMLQEQLAIVRGLEQDAHARVRLVEKELAELRAVTKQFSIPLAPRTRKP